jgi:hypothetical protein
MTKKNIQCSLAGLGRMKALLAQRRCGFDSIVGSGRMTMLRAWRWHGLTASRAREQRGVHSVVGSGRTTLLQVRERCCGLGDGAYMVDGVTGSGQRRWRRVRASTIVKMTARRLRRGLNDGTGSGEADDGVGPREIFGEKWQPNGVSESIKGLGFTKAVHQFIYRGTTVATEISDVIRAIATENHSSDG